MANVKKMIAFVIAICSFYCTFAFSITKAQTLMTFSILFP